MIILFQAINKTLLANAWIKQRTTTITKIITVAAAAAVIVIVAAIVTAITTKTKMHFILIL